MGRALRMNEDEVRAVIDRINRATGKPATAKPIEAITKRPKRMGPSELEHMFAKQMSVLELPPPRREFQFMPNRDFRLDYAWPPVKIAVEVNGMVHRIKERFLRDTEKVAYALIHGWIVLPVSGDDVRSGRGVSWLVTLMEQRGGGIPMKGLPCR